MSVHWAGGEESKRILSLSKLANSACDVKGQRPDQAVMKSSESTNRPGPAMEIPELTTVWYLSQLGRLNCTQRQGSQQAQMKTENKCGTRKPGRQFSGSGYLETVVRRS